MGAVNLCNALLTATNIASGAGIEEVNEILASEKVTTEEKTSFLIQYILSQRDNILDFGKTILFAIIVFFLGQKFLKLFLSFNEKWMEKREVEIGARKFIISFLKVLYNLLLIFVVAGILGIGTSSIIALVGSAGLAIGLALQGSLSNVAGGVLILLMKPFIVGDYILVDGVEGTVQSIDIFYTKIATVENKIIVIPNGTVSNSNVTNTTKAEYRMMILDFTVPIDADMGRIRKTILKIMKDDGRVCMDKDHSVVIDKLYPGRMKILAKLWTKTEEFSDVRYHMLEEIKEKVLRG